MFFHNKAITAVVAAASFAAATVTAAGAVTTSSTREHQTKLLHDVAHTHMNRLLTQDKVGLPQYLRKQRRNRRNLQRQDGHRRELFIDFDGDGESDMPGICDIVEAAINMGNEFGMEGNCKCVAPENIFAGGDISIDCNFPKVCYPDFDIDEEVVDGVDGGGGADIFNGWTVSVSEVCGSVSIQMKMDLDGIDEDDTAAGEPNDKIPYFGGGDEEEDVPVAILSDLFANGDGDSGYVSTTICVDMENDDLLETCFTYEIPLTLDGIINFDDHTCKATYGGEDCICRVDGPYCLYLNCTGPTGDPDAKMDTCQVLQMNTASDANTLLPKFPSFMRRGQMDLDDGNTDGIEAPNNEVVKIDWDNINWDEFDWTNFDWMNFNWDVTGWEDFLNDLPNFDDPTSSINVCSIVESVVGISQEFGIAGNCTCNGSVDTGLSINCEFDNECVSPPNPPSTPVSPSSATTRNSVIGGGNIEDVCGSVTMDFEAKNFDTVSVKVCVDFEKDEYDEYCFTYELPMAAPADGEDTPNTEWTPSCEATYGGRACKCVVDHIACVRVDCSEYLEDAKSDTCQDIRWAIGDFDPDSTKEFVPNWDVFLERELPVADETAEDAAADSVSELPANAVVGGDDSASSAVSLSAVVSVPVALVAMFASSTIPLLLGL